MRRITGWIAAGLTLGVLMLGASCRAVGTTDLGTLVRRDSSYLDPSTLKPFSGKVVRHFSDAPEKVQIEGTLRDGIWEGELTVYHKSGRIRYQGRMSKGAPCGAWLDNRVDASAGSMFDELKRDLQSMGVYPPCPDS